MLDLTPGIKEGPKSLTWKLFGYAASFGAIGFAWYFLWLMQPLTITPLFLTWVVVTVLVWLFTSPLRR